MVGFIVALLISVVFRLWFISPFSTTFSSGDWPYLFAEQIKEFSFTPEIRFLWLAPYYQVFTKFFVETLGLHWHLVERLLWFWPWIFISFFSAWKLTRSPLGGLIYTTNTYALMLVGGGQMGVAFGYALAPLVLTNVFFLPLQVMFDPRIALLTLVVAARKNPKQLVVPVLITILLHTYWLIPLMKNPLVLSTQIAEATSGAVKYLSFASFSNGLSLTHPNWPENIFGKVYFMRPEFLVIPLIAFGVLLLKNINTKVIYFAFLALFGAFLAKGTNEPFGGVYLWLFEHVPGFNMFRDATKFYFFVSLGYAFLIPYTIRAVSGRLTKWKVRNLPSLLFLIFWGFTLREAFMGKLTGTFQPIKVPVEYVRLKDLLINQPEYFQTAWYPKVSRFVYTSSLHPAKETALLEKQALDGTRYVIVPLDVRGELFVTDRMYDEEKHQQAIKEAEQMPWLRRMSDFTELAVFEVL